MHKNMGLKTSKSGSYKMSTSCPQGQSWRRNSRIHPTLPENNSKTTQYAALRIIKINHNHEGNHAGLFSCSFAAPYVRTKLRGRRNFRILVNILVEALKDTCRGHCVELVHLSSVGIVLD